MLSAWVQNEQGVRNGSRHGTAERAWLDGLVVGRTEIPALSNYHRGGGNDSINQVEASQGTDTRT